MAQQNFLLGKGERPTSEIDTRLGGSPKHAPYTFAEARSRLAPMVAKAAAQVEQLPPEACPRDEAVISLTLNPEYSANAYLPSELLRDVGVDVVGSRPRRTTPEKRSRDREPVETVTTELFVKGKRSTIRHWSDSLPHWRANRRSASDLISIEEIAAPVSTDKILGPLPDLGLIALETVLHASESEAETHLLQDFAAYLKRREIDAEFGRHFFAKGLCFLEIDAPGHRVEEIAAFTGVRALRRMPDLGVLRPSIRSDGIRTSVGKLPDDRPTSTKPS